MRLTVFNALLALLIVTQSLVLSACGQKGPLVLPTPVAAPSSTSVLPSTAPRLEQSPS